MVNFTAHNDIPLRIALIYAVTAGLWILLSDLVLESLVKDPAILTRVQTFKGWFFVGATALGLYLFIRRDVRVLRHSEAALRKSEGQFRIMVDTAQEGIAIIDTEAKIRYINRRMSGMLGYTADEMLGRELPVFMDKTERNKVMLCLERCKQGLAEREDVKFARKNGTDLWTILSASPLFDERGAFAGGLGMFTDITERKHAEVSLSESERKYHALFEQSKDAIYISSPGGELLDINPAGVALFGYSSKDDLLKVDIARDLFFNPGDRRKLISAIKTRGFVENFEVMLKKKNGEKLITLLSATAVCDENGETSAYQGFLRDITNQRRLEQQLFQSRKMEAIGRLAGGVAHDFNNILTAIIGYGSILQMAMPPEDPARAHVEQILALIDRAAHLTQSLLDFSRIQAMNPTPVNLNEIIRNSAKFLAQLIGEGIKLTVTLSDGDLTVTADRGRIEQVLMNLTTNARDAMSGRGLLSIRTEAITLTNDFLLAYGYGEPGSYARISVSDTGSGMDEKTKEKIFEPFFTTKEAGKGTGLGLSIVYGIIKQHKGYINVHSEPGTGTTFRIYLPLIRSTAEARPWTAPEALDR